MQGATGATRRKGAGRADNGDPMTPTLTLSPPVSATRIVPPPAVAVVKRRNFGTSPFDENWLNLDCCGLFCALLTYGLHIYGIYTVDFILIPPWFKVIAETGSYISFLGHMHRFLFTSVGLLACYAHWKAMTTDPGAVPPDASPLPEPIDEDPEKAGESEGQLLISHQQKGKRLCRRCKAFKPSRAHQCSVCKRCVIKMDHHCPWVNNCVGIGNHKFFLLFIFYTFLSCLYSMSLVVLRFVLCMHRYSVHTKRHVHCLDRPTHLLNILGLVVESMLFGLFTSCMMFDQWDVVVSNMTHIDRLKGDNNNNAAANLAGVTEVFGAPPKKTGLRHIESSAFRFDWLSPFTKVCLPLGLKDDIMGYCRPCGLGSSSSSNNKKGAAADHEVMEMSNNNNTTTKNNAGGRMVRGGAEIV